MLEQRSTGVFKLEDVTTPPSPPTDQTEHGRDLFFCMSGQPEGLFGAIEAIFDRPPLSRARVGGTLGGGNYEKFVFPISIFFG